MRDGLVRIHSRSVFFATFSMESHRLVLITGANRGFGLAMLRTCIAQNEHTKNRLTLVVTVRESSPALDDILHDSVEQPRSWALHILYDIDWSKQEKYRSYFSEICEALNKAQTACAVNEFVVIHNAGTLGDLSRPLSQMVTSTDENNVSAFYLTNVVAMQLLTAKLLHWAKTMHNYTSSRTVIVNVSSLLAVEPFPYWSLYAPVKAARDMLLRVAALEEDSERIKTLNYAPGPLDNSMQENVISTISDRKQRDAYKNMKENGKLVKEEASAHVLLHVINTNAFKSGDHVDYFDVSDKFLH